MDNSHLNCSKFLISLFLFFTTSGLGQGASAAEKVAVILSAGDLGQLENSMAALEKKAIKTYEELGFQVVVIGGVNRLGRPMTPQSLNEILGGLKGVKDLRFDFIGHGALAPAPARMLGGGIKISPESVARGYELKEFGEQKLAWYASNAVNANHRYYGNKAKYLGEEFEKAQHITHEDVQEALKRFRGSNPSSTATINLLNCFSGSLAQVLRHEPNTIVFANSPANQVAIDFSQWIRSGAFSGIREGFVHSMNGLNSYYDALRAENIADLTLSEARQFANSQFAGYLRAEPSASIYHGRSPGYESIIGWCESGKPGRLATQRPTEYWQSKDVPANSLAAIGAVELELRLIQLNFRTAKRHPSYFDEKQTIADSYKESFEECQNPSEEAKASLAKDESVRNQMREAWKKSRESQKSEPMRPLQMMFDRFLTVLNDPKKHHQIISNFKVSIDQDRRNLKGLPKDRWGALGAFIEKYDKGEISDSTIISKLKRAVETMKADCSAPPPESEKCLAHLLTNREVFQYVGNDISPTNCPDDQNIFECLSQFDPPRMSWMSAIERYWMTPGPAMAHDCSHLPWQRVVNAEAQIESETSCIRDFIFAAPQSEIENIIRLHELGMRRARDGTVIPKKPESPPKPGESGRGI